MAREKQLNDAIERLILAISRPMSAADNSTADSALDVYIEKLNALCASVEAKYAIPPAPVPEVK